MRTVFRIMSNILVAVLFLSLVGSVLSFMYFAGRTLFWVIELGGVWSWTAFMFLSLCSAIIAGALMSALVDALD